jgi:hypothetical protein
MFPKINKSYKRDNNIKDHLNKFHDNLEFSKVSIGSIINLNIKELTSWSADLTVAERFTNYRGSYGLVLMTDVTAINVLLYLLLVK